jgi:hypothetical protein
MFQQSHVTADPPAAQAPSPGAQPSQPAAAPTQPVQGAANAAQPTAASKPAQAPSTANAAQPSAATGQPAAAQPEAPPKPPQDPHRAHIVFTTIPMTNAKVVWGKQTLGMITPKAALTVVRPRDSGPLDVMVYAPGYLPVQTRAHTFEDQQIAVKLTTEDNKQTLWGYRAPLDAGVPPGDPAAMPAPTEEIAAQPL